MGSGPRKGFQGQPREGLDQDPTFMGSEMTAQVPDHSARPQGGSDSNQSAGFVQPTTLS